MFSRSRRFSTAHERSTQSFFCSRWIKFNQTLIFIVSNCVSPLRTISKKQAEKKLRFHIRFVSGQSQQVRILVFIEGIDIGCNSSSICNRNHGLSHCFLFLLSTSKCKQIQFRYIHNVFLSNRNRINVKCVMKRLWVISCLSRNYYITSITWKCWFDERTLSKMQMHFRIARIVNKF